MTKESWCKLCLQLAIIACTTCFMSCGADSHHFRIDGHLLNMNCGEFYVYSTDNAIDGMDTIKIQGGRFSYEIPCEDERTLVIVFPNFSEQPVFTKPGATATIKGDASHLKALIVKGTKANELMNQFREETASASPKEMAQSAEKFINDNPQSIASAYLLVRYFIQATPQDFKKINTLISTLVKEQPRNGALKLLQRAAKGRNSLEEGASLPSFAGKDINGKVFTSKTLSASPLAVITAWSSWEFESTETLREIKRIMPTAKGRLKALSICLDPSIRDCRQMISRDSLSWPNVCDGEMFEGKLVKQLGISAIPDNILLKNGKVIAHGLNRKELKARLEEELK